MRPVLLIGRRGQIAWELRRTLNCLTEIVSLDRTTDPAVDLYAPDTLVKAVRVIRPRLIINAAAYTAVDKAEEERTLAEMANARAPGVLAEAAKQIGAGLIHFSSDYVFAGNANQPYREDACTDPQSVYGMTKLAGEEAIRSVGGSHWIIRTAWVYGGRGGNFLLTMLRLMAEKKSIGVVADQHGSPTWSRLIAETVALMLAKAELNLEETSGTYHLTCSGETSWYGFAILIRQVAILLKLLPDNPAQVNAITSEEYPSLARRPSYSVLDTKRLNETFGLHVPEWTNGVHLCLENLSSSLSCLQGLTSKS